MYTCTYSVFTANVSMHQMCLCAFVCTKLCYRIPSHRDEGLSGFSKWDFQQGSREILLSRLHLLTSRAKGGLPGS